MTLARFQMCIGGEWVDALSGKTFESLNPAWLKPGLNYPMPTKPMSSAPCRLRRRLSTARPGAV